MKKLIVVAVFALALAGCAGWARLGVNDGPDHRQDQSQNQHYNEHAND